MEHSQETSDPSKQLLLKGCTNVEHNPIGQLRPVMTVAGAAKFLQVDVRVIRKAINTGELKAFRVGKRGWRIQRVDLFLYIRAMMNDSSRL